MRFTKYAFCCMGASVLLSAAASTQATVWTNDFDNFTGSDATAVSTYTDTNGGNPNQFEVASFFNGAGSLPAGWLTQGTVSGSNKSARFFNASETPTTINGRARFGTYLPTSMDALGGVGVAWRMRVGTSNPTRGPIQICLTKNGGVAASNADTTSAFIILKNSGALSTVDIARNGGGLYSAQPSPNTISQLTLGSNLADQYHDWMVSAIWRPSDQMVFWNLYLDGTQLLFGGAAGSPVADPDDAGPLGSQMFSFQSALHSTEGFAGGTANRPYIGLGELNNQNLWDFDFDYVNYRDNSIAYFVPEPASLMLLAVGGVLAIRRRR